MFSIKQHIPNAITSCNLMCGCLAVFLACSGSLRWSIFCVFLGALFDFFDGMVARLLHVSSPIGKELDSLADLITFGVAPMMFVFQYLLSELAISTAPALLIAVFSALRLAKFNLDERQTTGFIGLPTPANALFWIGLIGTPTRNLLSTLPVWVVYLLIALFCYLMVAEIPMIALKFKDLTWKNNKFRYILVGGSVIILLAVLLHGIVALHYPMSGLPFAIVAGFPFIIIWYIILSLVAAKKA